MEIFFPYLESVVFKGLKIPQNDYLYNSGWRLLKLIKVGKKRTVLSQKVKNHNPTGPVGLIVFIEVVGIYSNGSQQTDRKDE